MTEPTDPAHCQDAPEDDPVAPAAGRESLDSQTAAALILQRQAGAQDDECWPWQGRRGRKGYGVVTLGGRTQQAHRWAYERFVGLIPKGLMILHSCDNPPCVNPQHLRAGTHLDNMKDRTERKRGAQQQRTHCPKGHPYDEANTDWRQAKGRPPFRRCRTCKRLADKERNQRVREEARQVRGSGAPPEKLSPGLLDALRLTAAGLTRSEIAAVLRIDVHALDARRSEIYRKLRVANKQESIERGRQLGLITQVASGHDDGPGVEECAAADRVWPLEKAGE